MKIGATLARAARVGCEGARSSSTMMVTMIAITPSLKAFKAVLWTFGTSGSSYRLSAVGSQ